MKKGFTLVELLGVIVILGVIGVIVTPLIIGIINDSKDDVNEIQIETVKRAAKNYAEANIYTLPDECETTDGCFITIRDLKDGGYLEEKTLKDAKTDAEISDNDKVKISKEGNKYIYTYPVE